MTSAVEPGPRIGIIGTGAIGGFYGLMLARAGFDVHFLLRSEYAAVSERGLQLNSSVHGALSLHPVQAYANAADMPPCDWLLVGTKTTGNVELAPTIAQVAAPDAKVVLLQNGLGSRTACANICLSPCICSAGFVISAYTVPGRVSSSTRPWAGSVLAITVAMPHRMQTAARRLWRRAPGCSARPGSTPRPCLTWTRHAGISWCGMCHTTACRCCSVPIPRS